MTPLPVLSLSLADRIDGLLPQTQCQRCGFVDCRGYAEALARGESEINRCPPGGEATTEALAHLLGRPALPLADDLSPMPSRQIVHIDPDHCIGCTKCIRACPVDAIVGASRFQHQVLTDRCTGCELCLPPCPTDCIEIVVLSADWQAADATRGRRLHQQRDQRLLREQAREHATRQAARQAHPSGATQPPGSARPSAPAHSAASPLADLDTKPHVPDSTPRHGSMPTATPSGTGADTGATSRDPRIALAAPDEKARRLAAIRAKLSASKRPPTTGRPT
ncbi:MAG: RnfABCDGE type electron transport complex subunit B [Lautropia sp.]|nr:RnfABCDGE type electron transport complex subunit B [Lautropia sp.]